MAAAAPHEEVTCAEGSVSQSAAVPEWASGFNFSRANSRRSRCLFTGRPRSFYAKHLVRFRGRDDHPD